MFLQKLQVSNHQVTVLSCLVLSQKKEIHLQSFLTQPERTGPSFSAFKASADRPAQKTATPDVISMKLVT